MPSQLLLNINFCGTGIKATRAGVASVETINKFENTLILTGVGADSSYDKKSKISYPTPGTFYPVRDEKTKRIVAKKDPLRYSEKLFTGKTGTGLIAGAGEDSNIALAMSNIQEKMKNVPADQEVHLNISGFSRGGASAIRLANAIYRQYGDRIKLNLFLIEPNGGPGRKHSPRKTNIPPNVQNVSFSFCTGEKSPLYRAPTLDNYQFANPETKVASIQLPGNHRDQELQAKGKDWSDAAKTNKALLEKFFIEGGAKAKSVFFNIPVDNTANLRSMTKIAHPIVSSNLRALQEELARFSNNVGVASDPKRHLELQYQFYQLFCEISRELAKCGQDKDGLQKAANLGNFAAKATLLIDNLNPANNAPTGDIKLAMKDFKELAEIGGFTDGIKEIVGNILSLATAVVFGAAYAVGGALAGARRWKTAGTAALPCSIDAMVDGCKSGFNKGLSIFVGKQTERKIDDLVDDLIYAAPSA